VAGIAQVRKATRYGLDGPGTGRGKIFRARPDRSWGSPSHLYNGYWVIPGVNRPGRGVDRTPASNAEGKERVEPYLYFSSVPSRPVFPR
jgi:hypothetical protein